MKVRTRAGIGHSATSLVGRLPNNARSPAVAARQTRPATDRHLTATANAGTAILQRRRRQSDEAQ